MKVNHYIGLIGWRSLKFDSADKVYCDSQTLYWLARVFGKKLNFLPGPKLISETNFDQECIFLLPYNIGGLPESKIYILPMFDQAVYIDDKLKEFLIQNKNAKSLYVCISTPKQNVLGQQIAQYFNGEIHCIGAAINILERKDQKNTLILNKLNLLFLLFFFRSPGRTLQKIKIIVEEVFKIIFLKPHKKKFKAFLDSIN
tara:strand:+ start:6997 stop:7596 length:600 start_codon:yes stop_codon:yes gene_type:complete